MSVHTQVQGDAASVRVSEEATIRNADETAAAFRSALATKAGVVTLDLEGLLKVDGTFFQLVIALRRSLEKAGRRLVIPALAESHPVRRASRLLGLDCGDDAASEERAP